jgi:hypothetical protein
VSGTEQPDDQCGEMGGERWIGEDGDRLADTKVLVWQNNPISDLALPQGSAVLWLCVLDRQQQHVKRALSIPA